MTKLEYAIRNKRLKPRHIAKELAMHPSKLHYVMNGYQRIDSERRTRLAEITGLDPDELFDQVKAA